VSIPLVTILLAASALADKPAIAPAYVAPAAAAAAPVAAVDSYGAPSQDTYGAPVAPAAAPSQDSYGSPKEQPISAPQGGDSYGSPQAPVVSQPATAPVGNQGYYYYYYPVRQNAAPHHHVEESNDGLLGGLGGLFGAILGKKILLIALGITGFLVLTALGINFSAGRSFVNDVTSRAMPYMTDDNMAIIADFLQSSIEAYQNL